MSVASGLVSTFSGGGGSNIGGYMDGVGAYVRFSRPGGILALPNGKLLIADTSNHVIRKITSTGTFMPPPVLSSPLFHFYYSFLDFREFSFSFSFESY